MAAKFRRWFAHIDDLVESSLVTVRTIRPLAVLTRISRLLVSPFRRTKRASSARRCTCTTLHFTAISIENAIMNPVRDQPTVAQPPAVGQTLPPGADPPGDGISSGEKTFCVAARRRPPNLLPRPCIFENCIIYSITRVQETGLQ